MRVSCYCWGNSPFVHVLFNNDRRRVMKFDERCRSIWLWIPSGPSRVLTRFECTIEFCNGKWNTVLYGSMEDNVKLIGFFSILSFMFVNWEGDILLY